MHAVQVSQLSARSFKRKGKFARHRLQAGAVRGCVQVAAHRIKRQQIARPNRARSSAGSGGQRPKAETPICVTEAGMATETSAEQP